MPNKDWKEKLPTIAAGFAIAAESIRLILDWYYKDKELKELKRHHEETERSLKEALSELIRDYKEGAL